MANRNFANSRMYSGHVFPVLLDVSIPIGSTGAVGTITGPYIKAVTRLGVGTYQIQMQDNYSGYYMGGAQIISPSSGSALRIDATNNDLSVGTTYIITTLGDGSAAQFTALGVADGVTPAVGVSFVALVTGSGASSTTRVKAVSSSNIAKTELCANPNTSIAPMSTIGAGALGAIVLIQTLAASLTINSYTPAGTITNGTPDTFAGTPATLTGSIAYAPADPTSGSTLKLFLMLSNSSVLIGGE